MNRTSDGFSREQHGKSPGVLTMLCLALMLVLAVDIRPARTEVLELTGNDKNISASGYLKTLHDPTGRMTFADVMTAHQTFRPIPGPFNAGYSSGSAWWLHVTIRPATGAGGEWVLQVAAPYVDSIDIYVPPDPGGGGPDLIHSRAGALVPLRERDYSSHFYAVNLDLVEGRERHIYIRLAGSRALTSSLNFWREPSFIQNIIHHTITIGFIAGAASITSLGSIIFGCWLRQPAFLWYGIYLGLAGLVVLGNSGITAFLLADYPPAILLRLQNVIGCMTIMTAALMVRAIFCASAQHSVVGRILAGIGILAGCFAIVAAFGYYSIIAPSLHLLLLIVSLLLPWLAIMRLRRREPAAGWYFIGFTTYGFAATWFCLMVLGLVPMSTFGERGYQLISVLNMGAIFVGLATSVRAGARERRELQSQLLKASQQNARELELAVVQRTAALETEIEARRSAEQALIVAMREQRHFLGIVSHEFRTPLSVIRVAITTIERRLAHADAIVMQEAARIIRTVGRLSNLVNAFLADELLDKRDLRPRLAPLDVAALTRDIAHEHMTRMQCLIQVEAPDQLMINADHDMLRIAIENLVDNAVRHGASPIEILVHSEGNGIALTVSDKGPGIPPDQHDVIFERYHSGPSAQSGAGIGLSLVRRIALLHGGTVKMDSRLGAGSRFKIWLPCHHDLSTRPLTAG